MASISARALASGSVASATAAAWDRAIHQSTPRRHDAADEDGRRVLNRHVDADGKGQRRDAAEFEHLTAIKAPISTRPQFSLCFNTPVMIIPMTWVLGRVEVAADFDPVVGLFELAHDARVDQPADLPRRRIDQVFPPRPSPVPAGR